MRISDWSSDVCASDLKLQKLRDDRGFRLIFHGVIRIVPVTQDTKALKLCLLHVHPFLGLGPALGAEFLRGDFVLVLLFLSLSLFALPFDRTTAQFPAESTMRIAAQSLMPSTPDILHLPFHLLAL